MFWVIRSAPRRRKRFFRFRAFFRSVCIPALKCQRELEQKNMKEIFCDGVTRVVLSRGLVNIYFFHLVSENDGPHKPVPFLDLTIPVQGVIDMLEMGGQLMNHMTKIGMLTSPNPAPVKEQPVPVSAKNPEKKNVKSSSPASKKVAPAPAKKADAKPAAKKPAPVPAKKADAKPAAKPAPAPAKKADAKPAAKSAPAPAKKADAKPAAKPAPAPVKKSAPAPAKKADAKPAEKTASAKKPAKGKKSAK